MKELLQLYKNLKEDFLHIESLKLKLEKENTFDEEKKWNQIDFLVNQLSIKHQYLSKFINESPKTKKIYNRQLIELLVQSINCESWEDVYLTANLIDYKQLTSDSIKLICEGINKTIRKDRLITHLPEGSFGWNKSSLLESLVKLLNPNLEKERIEKTMKNILSKRYEDEDCIDYHLIQISNSMLEYLNKEKNS